MSVDGERTGLVVTGASGREIVSLRGVSRTYGTGDSSTLALRSVNLTVKEGEFVAIVGPSGAGKSTLLNILGLLDRPSAGTHMLDGIDVQTLGEGRRNGLRSERIGFVFQDSHMLMSETAADNTALGLKVQGLPLADRRVRVKVALSTMRLEHRANSLALSLSGGERQRAAIARAIATRPTILLADEPTGALDSVNSQRIMDHLHELNRAGVTVIIITHDSSVASQASRQVTLVDGVLDDRTAQDEHVSSIGDAPADQAAPSHSDREPNAFMGASLRNTLRPMAVLRRIGDELLDAISSHTGRPGRAALLLLAFLLGTGGLVASLGISQSAAAQVSQRLTAASLDEVVVRSTDTGSSVAGFYDRKVDGNAIDSIAQLHGVLDVGYIANISITDAHITLLRPGAVDQQPVFAGPVRVADSKYLEVQNARTTPSQSGSLLDNEWGGAIAVVGKEAATTLGLGAAGPGRTIFVGGRAVDVVGIISDVGRDSTLANTIVLSRPAAGQMTHEDPQLVIRTLPGFPAPVAEAVPVAVSPADPGAVRTETVADLRSLQRGVATDLDSLVGIIAWVLLALACLSAATAMYLSVQARSAEIGLRRAIGASRFSIWRIFTLEGLVIGTAGGAAGTTVGLLGVLAVSVYQGWTPTLDLSVVGGGIAAGAITGVLSATYPALLAARADPAQAIRR